MPPSTLLHQQFPTTRLSSYRATWSTTRIFPEARPGMVPYPNPSSNLRDIAKSSSKAHQSSAGGIDCFHHKKALRPTWSQQTDLCLLRMLAITRSSIRHVVCASSFSTSCLPLWEHIGYRSGWTKGMSGNQRLIARISSRIRRLARRSVALTCCAETNI